MDVLNELRDLLLPSEYTKQLHKNAPDDWLVLRKGAYMFAAVPFSEFPEGDYGSMYVKSTMKEMVLALPFLAEKGLFLLYYGPEAQWKDIKEKFKVDKTALRPVILQSVHFLDPHTSVNYNIRTHWGPVKFGFCSGVIEKIEGRFNSVR